MKMRATIVRKIDRPGEDKRIQGRIFRGWGPLLIPPDEFVQMTQEDFIGKSQLAVSFSLTGEYHYGIKLV